ncbi:MAG: glutamine-hydrolyzing carbamoyl-phosphate synthase small subunit [Candidatus Omnitrophica bacterium]|nr:glutamine-hydrolyzing carbamoyl-phosphate synthase small subunit [Candidatus Omnitrophota bacterium]
MKAMLMLEDGKTFSGHGLGACVERIGKAVLNTAVVGYQEMATDPANSGRLLVLTYPLIGNYGIAEKFNESNKAWAAGLIIKEYSRIYSNWQARSSLEDFAKEHGLFILEGIDTRTLAVHLRQKGEMLGIISPEGPSVKELSSKLDAFRSRAAESVLPQISVGKPVVLPSAKARGTKIAVLDVGMTRSVLRQVQRLGFSTTVLPYNTRPADIIAGRFRGLIISGGPEEDPGLEVVVDTARGLMGKIPLMGISAGHQALARALGAKIARLKLGHRGANYPMHNPGSQQGEITVQNHGLVVDAESLAKIKQVKITGYNLNDHSVEEMESRALRLLGVQYEPASPGFDQANPAFIRFKKMVERSN